MPPEVLVFMIPILGILTAMLAIFLKHREKMAGLDGGRGAQTAQILTETLERQHERIASLQKRVETLEMIVTDENAALEQQTRRARLHSPEADDAPDAVPPRTRTRA